MVEANQGWDDEPEDMDWEESGAPDDDDDEWGRGDEGDGGAGIIGDIDIPMPNEAGFKCV